MVRKASFLGKQSLQVGMKYENLSLLLTVMLSKKYHWTFFLHEYKKSEKKKPDPSYEA